MNKIERVSSFFKVFFQWFFLTLPVLQIVGWIYAPVSLSFLQHMVVFNVIPRGYQILHQLSINEKIIGFLISMVPTTINLCMLYFLIKLFQLYERGQIFSIANVNYIKKIGYALLLSQLIYPIYQALMGIPLTMNNPKGYRYAQITLDQTNIGIIIVALIVLLIAWIMAEGCKLNEEQQLTV